MRKIISDDATYVVLTKTTMALQDCRATADTFVVPREIRTDQKEKFIVESLTGECFSEAKVKHVTFPADSCVNKFYPRAFNLSTVESIDIPPKLTIFNSSSFLRGRGSSNVSCKLKYANDILTSDEAGLIYMKESNALLLIPTHLKHFVLRESLVLLSASLCQCYPNITRVCFPSSLQTIEDYCFKECKSLKRISFAVDSRLVKIGDLAFEQTSITKIILPSSIEVIGTYAFTSTPLKYVKIPDDSKITVINEGVFEDTQIKKIRIPPSVKRINQSAFQFCSNLGAIYFHEDSCLQFISFSAFDIYNNIKKIGAPQSISDVLMKSPLRQHL